MPVPKVISRGDVPWATIFDLSIVNFSTAVENTVEMCSLLSRCCPDSTALGDEIPVVRSIAVMPSTAPSPPRKTADVTLDREASVMVVNVTLR
jgi:hypothetical protein